MIGIECVLVNVVEIVNALEVHVDESPKYEGFLGELHPDDEMSRIYIRRMGRYEYDAAVTVAYIKVAKGFHNLVRVNSSFVRVLRPVMHRAKIATMHDRGLLRVVKANPAIKCTYGIGEMARLGVEIGRYENNNACHWFHPKHNPYGESRIGDIPWSFAHAWHHVGCRNRFEACLTIQDKYIVSSLCRAWRVVICNPIDTASIFRGTLSGCRCKVGAVCQKCKRRNLLYEAQA